MKPTRRWPYSIQMTQILRVARGRRRDSVSPDAFRILALESADVGDFRVVLAWLTSLVRVDLFDFRTAVVIRRKLGSLTRTGPHGFGQSAQAPQYRRSPMTHEEIWYLRRLSHSPA